MAMTAFPVYPVGTPGQPWGDAEREQWRALQTKKRDYFTDVLSSLLRFRGGDVFQYGTLDYRSYGAASYPLFAVKSSGWDAKKPMVLVTGGVHGYETSGVHGALLFVHQHLQSYPDRVNVLVLPCVSPWGYETINRWTPAAVDPNRCFTPKEPGCPEAAAAMKTIAEHVAQSSGILMHTDLHETTDTDNSEFTPAKTARDGIESPPFEPIPDGFYLVADSERVALGFHKALIAAVAKVTHIAPADEKGTILGDALEAEGIVSCTARSIGLCGGHTDAVNTTTTEVYPDSAKTDAETCNRAQVAAVVAGIEYSLAEAQSKAA